MEEPISAYSFFNAGKKDSNKKNKSKANNGNQNNKKSIKTKKQNNNLKQSNGTSTKDIKKKKKQKLSTASNLEDDQHLTQFTSEGNISDVESMENNSSFVPTEEIVSPVKKNKKSKNKRKVEETISDKNVNQIKETSCEETNKAANTKRAKTAEPVSNGGEKPKVAHTAVERETLAVPSNIERVNSIEEGERAFEWLLNPISVNEFMGKYWEQKSLLIKRQQKNYFSHLISFEAIDQMLLNNHVEFTKNLDVTSYKNGRYLNANI